MWVRVARTSVLVAFVLVAVLIFVPVTLVKFGQSPEWILVTIAVSPLPLLLLPLLVWVKERPLRVAALLEARLVTEEPVPQEVRRIRRAASRYCEEQRR